LNTEKTTKVCEEGYRNVWENTCIW